MTKFIGFHTPKTMINSRYWKYRLEALGNEYQGQWAKYGPYKSEKAARNKMSHVKTNVFNHMDLKLTHRIELRAEVEDEDNSFVYIRLTEL
jgi:N-methylhydantoinase A/oxoprolinase/acetone carboxylase beta subunit